MGDAVAAAMTQPRCETCRFYQAADLSCCRFPPVQTAYRSGFPTAKPEWWCGEYQQRPLASAPEPQPLPSVEDVRKAFKV